MKRQTAFQKLEARVEKRIGQVITYRGQAFEIRYDFKTYASPRGFYVTALENGRVQKGFGQWLSYRAMKAALSKLNEGVGQ